MQSITFSGHPVRNPITERVSATVDLSRVNILTNPLGRTPARGHFLLLKEHLDSLDLNGLHKVVYNDARWGTVTAYNLAITREPQKVHYTMNTGETLSCYLVEVTDRRGQLHNPIYQQSINKIYNVRESSSSYYADTLNGASPWTWAEMVEDLWGTMTVLGTWPTLPVTPTGTPENWAFQGVSAWASLCMVLEHIGCAVQCDLTKETDQYTIIELADTDPATTTLLDRLTASHRLLHDAEFEPVVRARVPYGVRVFFHAVRADAWTPTGGVYTVDVAGPDVQTAESSIYHPVWSDIPALYDSGGSLTNAATLATVAAEVADDFYKRIRGGGNRDYLCFDGAVSLAPGPLTRVITWRQNPLPLAEEGGIVTEIIRHPFSAYLEGLDCCFEDSTALHPPDLRIESFSDVTTFTDLTITNLTVTNTATYSTATITSTGSTWNIDNNSIFNFAGVFIFGTTNDKDTAPDGRLQIPTITTESGTPTWTGERGEIVYSEPDDKFWIWDEAESTWKEVGGGSGSSPTSSSGESVLSGDYTITTSYADTGLDVTLPTAGTYWVSGEILVIGQLANDDGDGVIGLRLYDETTGGAISGSETLGMFIDSAFGGAGAIREFKQEVPIGKLVTTVATNRVIRLEAFYDNTATFTTAVIDGTSSVGKTRLRYVKLA